MSLHKVLVMPVWVALIGLCMGIVSPVFSAYGQLDTDEILKPLVDTRSQSNSSQPIQGNVYKEQSGFPSQQPKGEPMLKIQVKTYQEAVILEKNTVDWYAWYLAVRSYLNQTGGLNDCVLGTPIKIYKQGRIEALSPDPICRVSVGWRKFPLPRNTQLDALILPVRSGKLPPASPDELQNRIQRQSSQ
jgi:hypothetical protein